MTTRSSVSLAKIGFEFLAFVLLQSVGLTEEHGSTEASRYELILDTWTSEDDEEPVAPERVPLKMAVRNLVPNLMYPDECLEILLNGTLHMRHPDGSESTKSLDVWLGERPGSIRAGELAVHPAKLSADESFDLANGGRHVIWWRYGRHRSNTLSFEREPTVYLDGHSGSVHDVAASPDGSYVASVGADGRVVMRALARPAETRVFGPYGGVVRCVSFSQEGDTLFAAGDFRSFSVLRVDLATGAEDIIGVPTKGSIFRVLSFDRDSKLACFTGGAHFHLIDLLTRRQIKAVKIARALRGKAAAEEAVASPDREHFAVVSSTLLGHFYRPPWRLMIFDQTGNKVLSHTLRKRGFGASNLHLAFRGDSTLALCSRNGGGITLWSRPSRGGRWQPVDRRIYVPWGESSTFSFSQDGKIVWLTQGRTILGVSAAPPRTRFQPSTIVFRRELNIGKKKGKWAAGPIRSIAVVPNGQLLVAGLWDGRVALVRTSFGHTFWQERAQSVTAIQPASSLAPMNDLRAELLHAFRLRTPKYSGTQKRIAKALVELGDRSVIPELEKMLTSPDRRTRCNTGLVLAGLADERGLDAVMAEANDKDPRRVVVVMRFGLGGGGYSEKSQVCYDRDHAMHVLAEIGDRRAAPVLIEALKEEDERSWVAAVALGDLRDERALPALRAMLAQSHFRRRVCAAYGLAGCGAPEGVPMLIEFLGARQPLHRWLASCFVEELRYERAIVKMIRRPAAEFLVKLRDERGVAALIRARKSRDPVVRVCAAKALGATGDKEAVRTLRSMLRDRTSRVRLVAALGLSRRGEAAGSSTLVELLTHENWRTRRGSAFALGQLGDTRGVPALIRALKDEHASARIAAAEALGHIADRRAIRALSDALDDTDACPSSGLGTVRRTAMMAIWRIQQGSQDQEAR